MRTIRIGLLGLGNVGGAVVRSAAPASPWIASSGLTFVFERALVRNVNRPGRPNVPLVDQPREFLAGEYDLVVEALGGVEPARTLVTALLKRGTPVVTANKSLLATAARDLTAAAARGRTVFRYEATALAGVPFIGTLGARPLTRAIERLSGIVNGTSNFILSSMEADGLSFAEALHRAQALGLAEPDPRADIEGRDALEKLVLLIRHLGGGDVGHDAIERQGIDTLDTADVAAARTFGGCLKPIVHADLQAPGDCFVGPAFVEESDPLARVDGALNGIRLDGRFVRRLFFSGPGAGPDVTAATILDDIVEAVRTSSNPFEPVRTSSNPIDPHRTQSWWFLRLAFAPEGSRVNDSLSAAGISLERTSSPRADDARLWAVTHPAPRESIASATASLTANGVRVLTLHVLEPHVPKDTNNMKFATRTIHAAQPSDPTTGALIAPIFQTSTYEQEEPGIHKGFDYSRTRNPTRERLERVLADLEGVRHAAVFASGLAAETAVLQAYLKPGDEVVTTTDVYGGTWRLLHRVFQPLGCVIRQVDASDLEAVAAAVSNRTRLVWIESPTNPRLLVCDIAAIARIAHERGALLVADNTFATPFFQQPFELGADIVVHSVTKYLAGHSDLIQGAALAREAAVFEPIAFLQNASGGVPSPFDCWLTLRGLKTLELRMLRHAENAAAIAEALTNHPLVRRVYFPGLSDHPGHTIARRQMTGFGGMVSFELDGRVEDVVRFVSSRRFFALGESLGGVKSLICHPVRMTHASIPPEARSALGLTDTLVRLSPGCENGSDLVEDLLEGLESLRITRDAEAAAVV
jgi:cystathionine beta-lyase/cystathionine gamma-synthase/homoserine dehydrogenase